MLTLVYYYSCPFFSGSDQKLGVKLESKNFSLEGKDS